MKAGETVLVYVATYARLDDAKSDYELVTRLYAGGIVRAYEATVISRELDGKLKIVTADRPDRGRAWIGLAAGDLGGLFLPPFLLWDDAIGAGAGAMVGTFWLGLSRDDLRVIGDMLEDCAGALIVFSESQLQSVLIDTARGTFKVFHKAVTTAA